MSGTDQAPVTPYLLVIDDNLEWAELIKTVAERGHYRAAVAPSAGEGLEMIAGDPPDIIALDIFMPDMDGIEVIWALGKLPRKPDLLLISGNATPMLHAAESLAEENGLTVLGVFAKPVRLTELRSVLEKAFADRQQVSEPRTP